MIYLSRPKQHAYVSGSTNLTTPLCQDEATTPTLIQRPVMSSPSATSRVAVAGSTVPASLLCRICSAPVLPCRIRAPDRFIVVVVRAEMQFIGEEVETRSRASVEARLRGRMPRGARRVGQRLRGEAPRRRRYQDAVECGSNAQESHHGKRERGGEDSVVAAAASASASLGFAAWGTEGWWPVGIGEGFFSAVVFGNGGRCGSRSTMELAPSGAGHGGVRQRRGGAEHVRRG